MTNFVNNIQPKKKSGTIKNKRKDLTINLYSAFWWPKMKLNLINSKNS